MTNQDDKSIASLISKMQQKKDELLTELEKVQKWLNQVETFINQGKAIIGEGLEPIAGGGSVTIPELPAQMVIEEEPPETKAGRVLSLIKPNAEKSHAEKIKQLFEESGGPLSLAQLDEQFSARSWPINCKKGNRRLILYNSMKRRPDLFGKVGDKLWGLKGRDDQESSDPTGLLTGL